MICCFNGSHTESTSINPSQDRGFLYGDGLFESIRVEKNCVLNFEKHFSRLEKGMKILRLSVDNNFGKKILKEIIETCYLNKLTNARVKLVVWRNYGGLYTPTNNSIYYLISCTDLTINTSDINSLGVAKEIKISYNQISSLKTLNSLPYILASIEKKERKLDEIMLLNTDDFICECSSSNIFWSKENSIYTPSLESGCIAGISREIEIENLKLQNIKVIEGLFPIDALKNADKIWITNTFSKRLVTHLLLDN